MTTEAKAGGMRRSRNDEVIGKIFVALSQDMRRCLICDGVFTKQGSAAHGGVACRPSDGHSGLEGESEYADRCPPSDDCGRTAGTSSE
jgi:hypothetical protein